MATSILGSIGASVAGPTFSGVGMMAGTIIGSHIDSRLFSSPGTVQHHEGRKLEELHLQSMAYGNAIPQIYGTITLAGNIIWALPLKEEKNSITTTNKSNASRSIKTNYAYYATFAIAICEGEIDKIERVFVDEQEIDLNNYTHRIFLGSEQQTPDPLIEAIQGIDNCPAFKGIAYVVFENFPITYHNNRLPNLVFEVTRKRLFKADSLESRISGVNLIPGSGEFVYSTTPIRKQQLVAVNSRYVEIGKARYQNKNLFGHRANVHHALDNLQNTLPNIEWVAPVVGWFTNTLEAGKADLVAGVEYKGDSITKPYEWEVAHTTRSNAYLISQKDNSPIYGGTPSDQSILELLQELRGRHLKIMLYPMFYIDTADKPWRGRLSGSGEEVSNFILGPYRKFLLHYANLAKGKIDAFILGSELIGITKVRENGIYPGVQALCQLAKEIKAILGQDTTLTYAADWSEYHHTDGGFYNLDELWASEAIDCIGIDAYFPLSRSNKTIYDPQEIEKGWVSGEGYTFYYDQNEQKQLNPQWAWKNLRWWWENKHVNADGTATKWVPKSKKIWFTEFGFPSIDCATNQPNVFYSPDSQESGFPILSSGKDDYRAQKQALHGTLNFIEKNKDMVANSFIWSWDARPFPLWPNRKDLWADGDCYFKGHWIQGKLGLSSLREVIKDLLLKAGFNESQYDLHHLDDDICGLVINYQGDLRQVLEQLRQAYFFDIIEENGKLIFKNQKIKFPKKYDEKYLLKAPLVTQTEPDLSPTNLVINYIGKQKIESASYRFGNFPSITLPLPIKLPSSQANNIAKVLASLQRLKSKSIEFEIAKSDLTTGDLISHDNEIFKIEKIYLGASFCQKIFATRDNPSLYSLAVNIENRVLASYASDIIIDSTRSNAFILDGQLILASECLDAANVYISDDNIDYRYFKSIESPATFATVTEFQDDSITLALKRGEVICDGKFVSSSGLINVDGEIIAFQYVEQLAPYYYQISQLKRGMFNSLKATTLEGVDALLLDENILTSDIPKRYLTANFYIKFAVSDQDLKQAPAYTLTPTL